MVKKTNKKSAGGSMRRAKPVVPKAGITRTHRRYGCGGKMK